jgi:hypothetical protein
MRIIGFLVTFLGAWFALDRLAVSPPMPLPAALALGVALVILAVGEVLVFRTEPRSILRTLGYGRPDGRAIGLALLIGALVIGGYVAGAALLGVGLELRPEWPLVLVGALLFHGLAEETVWRGFVYSHARAGRTFAQGVLLSMPLIVLTHAPIVADSGWLVGGLAMLTAAVTCLPLAYLWDKGGATVWAPAIVHGLIGSWQVFDRTYPMSFSMVVLVVSIVVPLLAFPIGKRLFRTRDGAIATAPVVVAAA